MNTKEDQTPPLSLPPFPPFPNGFSRWEYRGMGWNPRRKTVYTCCLPSSISWDDSEGDDIEPSIPAGMIECHYIEAVTDTPPAERPTPITDAASMGARVHTGFLPLFGKSDGVVRVCPTECAEDLERQLAESKENEAAMRRIVADCQCPSKDADIAAMKGQLAEERKSLEAQREVIALQYCEIDKLRDSLAKSEQEIERLRSAVDESNIAELNRQLADARKELAETDKDYQCLASRLDGHDATECRMNLDRLIARLSERTAECEEQARLLGMSGEREARLIAERDRLVSASSDALKCMCRVTSPDHEFTSTIDALDSALAAVKGVSNE